MMDDWNEGWMNEEESEAMVARYRAKVGGDIEKFDDMMERKKQNPESAFLPTRELNAEDKAKLESLLLEHHSRSNGNILVTVGGMKYINTARRSIGTHLIAAGIGILISITTIIMLDMRRLDFYPYEDIAMLSIGPLFIVAGLSRLKA